MTPNVSVIVPFRNSQLFITDCIKSISNQTLKNIEIIFIDDNSIDGSKKIILEFAKEDSRIKIVKNNYKGAAGARNTGIEIAKGDYLSILDSDDIFDKKMLEEMHSKASSLFLDTLICPWRYVGEESHVARGITLPISFTFENEIFNYMTFKDEIFQITSPNAWSKMYNRSFIIEKKIRFQNLTTCNDLFFTYLSIILSNRISILNKSFVSYRLNNQTSISSKRGKDFTNIFKSLSKLKTELQKIDAYSYVEKSFLLRALSCISYELKFVEYNEISQLKNMISEFFK